MKIMVDSFAWLAYFKKERGGEKVYALLKNKESEVFTTAANLYEIYYRLSEDVGKEKLLIALSFIKTRAKIVAVDELIAEIAAEVRLHHGLKAIDAFTYAAAKQLNAKVVTGDRDFSKLDNVILI
ncbi:MAG: PIN domain-containing protein [Candidatus Micrarchaeota archaeon]